MTWSESDFEDSDKGEMLNFVAYLGVFEDEEQVESDEEDNELSLYDENKFLFENLIKTKNENIELESQNIILNDYVKHLRLDHDKLKKEIRYKNLQGTVDKLRNDLKAKIKECQKMIKSNLELIQETKYLKEQLNYERVSLKCYKVVWMNNYATSGC